MLIDQKIEKFVKREGRRPRILVSSMGKKRHNQDTRRLATIFAETGFDVDISPLHQTARGTARMAIENDVHIICFLSIENNHKELVMELARALKAEQAENIRILVGGAIPRSDYDFIYSAGVDQILNSVRIDKEAVNRLLDLFE
ncbi:MAG: cobalamin-dependent protein [Deltaproteobacteria bacterium]|jgi:methylmalonyl-CoA mutase|nr:cobalamin-dependent protein [Deltaproteobacteria bacterium]